MEITADQPLSINLNKIPKKEPQMLLLYTPIPPFFTIRKIHWWMKWGDTPTRRGDYNKDFELKTK